MTHVSDNYRTGEVFRQVNGTNGAATSPIYVMAVVPPPTSATALAAAQTVSGTTFTLQAVSGITTTTIQGVTYYDLGVARCLTATGQIGTVTATSLTVRGIEETVLTDGTLGPGLPMQFTFNSPVSGLTTTSTKAIRYVRSVTAGTNTTSGVSLGVSDTLGFPYKVANYGDVHINWNNVWVTSSTGFTAAVTTSPSTAATGDVRGTYALQGASADGALAFRAYIFVLDPDTEIGLYGKAQFNG